MTASWSSRAATPLLITCVVIVLGCVGGPVELEPLIEPPDLELAESSVRNSYSELIARWESVRSDGSSDRVRETMAELARWFAAYRYDEAARPALRNMMQLSPDDYQWVYMLSRVESRAGSNERAVELLQHTLRLRENYLPALVHLASHEAGLGEIERARSLLERGPNSDARVGYELAQLDIAEGRFEEARERLMRVVAERPNATAAHQALAIALRSLGDELQAEEHVALAEVTNTRGGESLIEPQLTDPVMQSLNSMRTDSRWLMDRGRSLMRRGRYERAIEHYERAVAAAPDNPVPLVALAGALTRRGRSAQAVAALSEAIELDPNQANARAQLAQVLARTGYPQEAMSHLDQVVEIDPRDTASRLLYARLLSESGDEVEAIEQVRALLALDPSNAEGQLRLISLLMQRDNCPAAIEAVDQAAGLRSDDEVFLLRAAWIHAACGPNDRVEDGLALVERAIQANAALDLDMMSSQAAQVLARLEFARNRRSSAEDWQRRAIAAIEAAGGGPELGQAERRLRSYRSGAPPVGQLRFPATSRGFVARASGS